MASTIQGDSIGMLTTLDATPQEWMVGEADVVHTVAACHFQSTEHAEYWINELVPRNQSGHFVKWSGGRRLEDTRKRFIGNCLNRANELDFSVTCVSSKEGEMSWFAWSFYFQNREFIKQELDSKNRNCLVFTKLGNGEIKFPVLRAGYLIWYHNVICYLTEGKGITGRFLSDNFCRDQPPPGVGSAEGVSFVNYLLSLSPGRPQISLPVVDRYKELDRLSDYMCGWVNAARKGTASKEQIEALRKLEDTHPLFENLEFAIDMKIVDEAGADITDAIKAAVVSGSAG